MLGNPEYIKGAIDLAQSFWEDENGKINTDLQIEYEVLEDKIENKRSGWKVVFSYIDLKDKDYEKNPVHQKESKRKTENFHLGVGDDVRVVWENVEVALCIIHKTVD